MNVLENITGIYAMADQVLYADVPAWLPCNRAGCCDGRAECCREHMTTSVTWLEMYAVFEILKTLPADVQRGIAARARAQIAAVRESDGGLLDRLAAGEMYGPKAAETVGVLLQNLPDHACPLLNQLPGQPVGQWECWVRAARFMVCRGYGLSAALRYEKNAAGETAQVGVFMGCDAADLALRTHEEREWPNQNGLQKAVFDAAAPRYPGMMRAPLITKPAQFWLDELADDDGLFTDPQAVFEKIIKMLRLENE